MPRENHDWITAFLDYTSHGEAPTKMYFWVAVATIAGALRRRVWVDQAYFKWFPNLYTILVAPPGVVSKSTTADLGMDLLRSCPGIVFGPDVTTWQALFDALNDVHEGVPWDGETLEMSPLIINASELGYFLHPDDTVMVDQLVNLWDGKPVKTRTRMHGEAIIQNPCLNLLGCTTPSWIAQNFPEYMIGGGFTSRVLFVYADTKAKYVAYPCDEVPPDHLQKRDRLIRDLEKISTLLGPVAISTEAKAYGKEWYEAWHRTDSRKIDETILAGYINRKQTLVHKIAMCIVASRGDSLIIEQPDLERAVKLITELEDEMPKVYSRIGTTKEAQAGDVVLAFIQRAGGSVAFQTLYAYMRKVIPIPKDFEDILTGLHQAGLLRVIKNPNTGLVTLELPNHGDAKASG